MSHHPDGVSATIPSQPSRREPAVRVFLPLEEEENNELPSDQTEQVILNGSVTQIRRGEYVEVKVPVFMQLRQRYPNL